MDKWDMASPTNNSGASEPKKKSSHTLKLTSGQMDKLANVATADGQPVKFPYARHAFDGDRVKVVAYEVAIVVQGGKTEFCEQHSRTRDNGEFLLGYEEVNHPEWFEPHAGLDESGKGDLFGSGYRLCNR